MSNMTAVPGVNPYRTTPRYVGEGGGGKNPGGGKGEDTPFDF